MDLELIKIVRQGDVDGLKLLQERDPNKLHQETPVGNTLLHLAAKFGHLNFLVEVCEQCPSLITKINKFGDTALHVGARTQNKLEFIQYLIDKMASSSSSDLLRSQNHKGDSALHEALRYCRRDVAKLLIQKDPHLCLFVNKASESPLFLAVTKGYADVVFHILDSSPSAPCDGPKGWTALHACAISEEKGLVPSYMAEKLLQLKPEMGRVVDIYGRTSLHYAVDSKKVSIVELLLQHDPSIAYIQDKDGWSPLHVAVSRWSMFDVDPKSEDAILKSIVENIIRYCPDSEYLVDNGGNNILHLLLLESKMLRQKNHYLPYSAYSLLDELASLEEELLNQPNNDGNTPLHLVTLYGQEDDVARILARKPRVDKKARNNNNLTAYDIARKKLWISRGKGKEKRSFWSSICSIVCPNDDDRISSSVAPKKRISSSGPLLWIATLNPQEFADEQDAEKRQKEEKEACRKLSKTHMLVATLIATVAFAAAFQMPGGYESGGDEQQGNHDNKKKGMAVLAGEAAFMAFLIFDVIALSCSVLTLLLYFFAEIANYAYIKRNNGLYGPMIPLVPTIDPIIRTLRVTGSLIFGAIVAMTLAFTCGVFGVLVRTHSLWIGIVTVLVFLCIPFLSFFILVRIYINHYDDD